MTSTPEQIADLWSRVTHGGRCFASRTADRAASPEISSRHLRLGFPHERSDRKRGS